MDVDEFVFFSVELPEDFIYSTYFSRNPWYNNIKILLREMKLK